MSTVETTLYSTLKGLVSNRVYRDVAQEGSTLLPRITFQFVGGVPTNFLDGAVPSKTNYRVQINCWHKRRDDANALARQVAAAMGAALTLNAVSLGGFVSVHEKEPEELYGTRQDFSVWF